MTTPYNMCSRCRKTFDNIQDFAIDNRNGFYLQTCKVCYEKSHIRYELNKDIVKELITIDYKCDCGKTIKMRSNFELDRHLKSKYHQKRI